MEKQNEILRGAEIFCRALKDEGVKHLFGYPGGAVLHIYDELYKQDNNAFQEVDSIGISRPCVKHNFLVNYVSALAMTIKYAPCRVTLSIPCAARHGGTSTCLSTRGSE